MKHVVVSEPYICPKCLKTNMGSAEAILDLLICPKCAEKYRKDLMSKIETQVREFFQPERSKREDLDECIICKEKVKLLTEKETCENCHYKIIKNIHSRCGALNSMET